MVFIIPNEWAIAHIEQPLLTRHLSVEKLKQINILCLKMNSTLQMITTDVELCRFTGQMQT